MIVNSAYQFGRSPFYAITTSFPIHEELSKIRKVMNLRFG